MSTKISEVLQPDLILGGGALPAPRVPSQCFAAYSRFVAFKKQMFGVPTFAVPTSGECLPYMMAQYDLVELTVERARSEKWVTVSQKVDALGFSVFEECSLGLLIII